MTGEAQTSAEVPSQGSIEADPAATVGSPIGGGDATATKSGRFTATIGRHEALDVAAQVARAAASDGEDPWKVGRHRFDTQHKALGLKGLSSKGLTQRFGMPLRQVIVMACAETAERGFASRRGGKGGIKSDMPVELMLRCVKAAAYQLGGTPSVGEYEEWAERHERERRKAGGPEHFIPRSVALLERIGSWQDVLKAADLDPAAHRPRSRRALVPDLVEVLDGFVTEHGILPSARYFERWCTRMDIPVSKHRRTWKSVYDELRSRRSANGLTTPEHITPVPECPPLPEQVSGGARGARRRRRGITLEDCLDSLRLYAAEYLPAGRRPTQAHYRGCALADQRMVSPTTLFRFGRFQDLCRQAGV